jgi:glycosyltransferase involved in cell wall biosynthesis
MNLKDSSFIIVSHIYATGPAFRLEEYLRDKACRLVFIGHPFSFTKDNRSFARIYKNGKLTKEEKFVPWKGPELFFYFKDILLTLWWSLRFSARVDYFVGVDNLNVFSGIILKLLGKVRRIIFYTIDYVPNRFENKVLNYIYHFSDRLAVGKSDRVWNLSSIMVDEREKRGVSTISRKKQIVVPIGTDIPKKLLTFDKIDKYKMVFMGHLRGGQGVELLLDVMPDVVRKVAKAHLLIVGGGPLENMLKKLVETRRLTEHIKFTGFVKDYSDVEGFLSDAAIAVAPYADDGNTFTRYTDPGKPKDYLASGIPVVITKVPQIAYEIEKNRCGIAIKDNRQELTDAIVTLLTDEKMLYEFRENAIKMAKKYTWDKIFSKAFSETL